MKLTPVDKPRDDLAHVERQFGILVDDAGHFLDRIQRFFDGFDVPVDLFGAVEVEDDVADFFVGFALFIGEIVRNPGLFGVNLRTAEFVGIDDFVQGGLHDGRSAEVNAADVLDDDDVVG